MERKTVLTGSNWRPISSGKFVSRALEPLIWNDRVTWSNAKEPWTSSVSRFALTVTD